GAPGSGHVRFQAAVFDANADYKRHPSFPSLEAYVNLRYGPFNHANLLHVRGEICVSRRCGTADADRLFVEEVVAALSCESATVPNPPASTGAPAPAKTCQLADVPLHSASAAPSGRPVIVVPQDLGNEVVPWPEPERIDAGLRVQPRPGRPIYPVATSVPS